MKFTIEQALAITGYTGIMACNFADFQNDVEKRLGQPVFTHEFASEHLWKHIKELYTKDFLEMCLP